MFDWGAATDAEAVVFVRSLSIGHHAEIAVLTSLTEPVVIYPLMYFLRHLDAVAGGRQQYFAFGLAGGEILREMPAEFEIGCTIWGHKGAV